MSETPAVALYALCLTLAVLPVVVFLLALVGLDSYKLVRFRTVLVLLGYGSAAALFCLFLNPWLQRGLGIDSSGYARYCGPIVEELAKGSLLLVAIARKRIGFLVDAAIWGFAIGAGFAAVENIHYFVALSEPNPTLWTIRGFGTAIMHGGVTSILGVTSKQLSERVDATRLAAFVPGLLLAAAIHSLFNHFYLSPSLTTVALLVGLPLLFVLVFRVSEGATQDWLGVGFDTDQELLAVINRGRVSETRVGRYLGELKRRFPPETVVDMLCLIRIHLELAIRAKGMLLMRKAGFGVAPNPKVEERLRELQYLEKSIGRTGLIALTPIFHQSTRDLWQIHMLRHG